MTTSAPRCLACSTEQRYLYHWGAFDLYRCPACGLETTKPLPTTEHLKDFYQSRSAKKLTRKAWRLPLVARAFNSYLKDFRKFTGREQPDAFVDIGAGEGLYVRAAHDRGIISCYMDYAMDALEFARSELGIKWIVRGDVQRCADSLQPQTFDFALARHVIEHQIDPALFLQNVAKTLKPGGLLQIETPNAASPEQWGHPMQIVRHWQILRRDNPKAAALRVAGWAMRKSFSGVNPPKHLWGFTEQSLTSLLEHAGFEIVKVRRAVSGDPIYDPLFYDYHSLSSRRRLGIPYYFYERVAAPLFLDNGTNLAILARLPSAASPPAEHTISTTAKPIQ